MKSFSKKRRQRSAHDKLSMLRISVLNKILQNQTASNTLTNACINANVFSMCDLMRYDMSINVLIYSMKRITKAGSILRNHLTLLSYLGCFPQSTSSLKGAIKKTKTKNKTYSWLQFLFIKTLITSKLNWLDSIRMYDSNRSKQQI